MRVTHARELVAEGYALAAVARVMQITRQAIYRTPKPRSAPQRRPPAGEVEQAFIESWFAKLKERCIWRHEFETLDQAREVIAAYITSYHDRPHSGLAYRTPSEVRQTWDDADQALHNAAA